MDGSGNSPITTEVTQERRGISGSTLKIIAIITMLIDHTAATVLSSYLNKHGLSEGTWYNVYNIMRGIGRLAFPIFCFLLVEGFIHTHNKWKYALRLAIFALVSEIPFDLAFFGKPFYLYDQNVFFTLLIGLLVMIGFEVVREKCFNKKLLPVLAVSGAILAGVLSISLINQIMFINSYILEDFGVDFMVWFYGTEGMILKGVVTILLLLLYLFICKKKSLQTASILFADLAVLCIGIMLANLLMTDYSGFGVLTIAVMYILRWNRVNSMLGGCATLTIFAASECPAFIDLLLIKFYNGKRGLKLKYLFYGFYPVHLVLLYLICYFAGRL